MSFTFKEHRPKERVNDPSLRRQTVCFGCAYGVYYGIYCLFLSFMVTYLTMAGYSPIFCGVAGTLTYLISILTQPLMGYLTDSVLSIRRCLQIAVTVTLAGTVLLPSVLSRRTVLLLVLTVVAGVTVPMMSLLDVWVLAAKEDTPKLNYPLVRAWGSLAYGFTSLIMGRLVQQHGVRLIFQVQIVFCLLLILVLHRLPEISMHNRTRDSGTLSLSASLRIICADHGFRFAVILMLLHWLTHRMIGSYLALLVQAVGGDTSAFGIVTGLGGYAEIIIPLFGYRWIRRCPLDRLLLICLAINFVRPVFCWLSLPFGTAFFAAGQIIQSIGFSIYFTASVECLSRLVPYQIKNTAISLGLALSSLLGTVLANFAGGLLIEFSGALSTIPVTLVLGCVNIMWLFTQSRRFPQLKKSIDECAGAS